MTVASRTSADPLGPDSLTWKYFGDLRTGMMGVWIGAIQNMYPELGAGVEEHSILLREPLQRVARSVYPIMGVVYDGDRAAQTGQQIKGYHRTIKGVDAEGRRYHALNPDTFYWAHATFFMLVIKVAEYFCGGLTEAEKHQLFEEHVRWYRMYGMSMRPVPKSWEDFQDYWDRVCRDKLEQIAAAAATLRLSAPPDIGMCTRWSAKAAISADNPCASGPNSHAVGSASSRSASSRAISPSTAVASTCSPAARRSAMAAPTSGATTTGIAKMLPVDARRHLPLYGSTLRPARITAAAPMASAMRITVPALPGSRISTVTAIS